MDFILRRLWRKSEGFNVAFEKVEVVVLMSERWREVCGMSGATVLLMGTGSVNMYILW